MPHYLTHDSDSAVVTLAGHDRGEQPFMADLAQLAQQSAKALTVVFIAGGRFWLPGETAFNAKRRNFYGSINWSEPIAEQVSTISADHEPFIGIHVRGTDKAITVPTQHAMKRSIAAIAEQSGLTSVLVAADTAQTRSQWLPGSNARACSRGSSSRLHTTASLLAPVWMHSSNGICSRDQRPWCSLMTPHSGMKQPSARAPLK